MLADCATLTYLLANKLAAGRRNAVSHQPTHHKIARVTATPLRVLSDFSWLGVKIGRASCRERVYVLV